MNRLILLLMLSFLLNNSIYSQRKPRKHFFISEVSSDGTKKLYTEIDNPITVVLQDCPCEDLIITSNRGKLVQFGPCKYGYTTDSIGKVTFLVTRKGKKQQTIPFDFKVFSFPDVSVTIGNRSGGEINRKDLLKEKKLFYDFIEEGIILCGVPITTESFTFLAMRDTSIIYIEKNTVADITDKEKEAIRNSLKGDKNFNHKCCCQNK